MRRSMKCRYYAGLVIFILGLFISCTAFATGVIGILIHCSVGNLVYVGNHKMGPGITIALMLEGFILDLAPSIATALLGYFIKTSNRCALESSKKLKKKKLKDKKDVEGFIRLLKSRRKGKTKEEMVSENEEDFSKINLLEEDEPIKPDQLKSVQKYRCNPERYVKESPKYLFLSLFLMIATNLGMALTCYLMSRGLGTAQMMDVTKSYLTEKKARTALDWVQQKGECCGEQVFTEWFGIKWCMETKERPPTEYNLKNFNICPPERRTVKFDVPSSCCTPLRSPCIHDALDILGLGPLNMEGCKKYMNEHLNPLYKSLTWYHVCISLLKFILMILVFTVRPSAATKGEAAMDEERKHLIQREDPPKVRPNASASLTSVSSRPNHTPAHFTSSLGRIPSSFRDFDDSDILSSTQNPTPASSSCKVHEKPSKSATKNTNGAFSNEMPESGMKRFSSDSIELGKRSDPAQIEPSVQETQASSLGNARTN